MRNIDGRLGQFWSKTWKVFVTKHIGNNDTMACETHGIHSTRHNGDGLPPHQRVDRKRETRHGTRFLDRKSTRLNSSHSEISRMPSSA